MLNNMLIVKIYRILNKTANQEILSIMYMLAFFTSSSLEAQSSFPASTAPFPLLLVIAMGLQSSLTRAMRGFASFGVEGKRSPAAFR